MSGKKISLAEVFGLDLREAAEAEAELFKHIVSGGLDGEKIKKFFESANPEYKPYLAFRFGMVYTMSLVSAGGYDDLRDTIYRRYILAQHLDKKELAEVLYELSKEYLAENPPENSDIGIA